MCALEERTGAYSYQQRVQKLEHLLVHSRSPGRYPGGSTRSMEDGNAVSAMDAIGGGDSPILESPPAALSNVHDLFFHVAAREEALHSLVQTGKTAYSCERRRRADERDLLIDADRSETLKKAKSRNPHGLQAGLMTAPPAQGVAGQGALQGTMSSIGPGFTITNHSFGNMSSSCRQGASTPDTTRATTTGLFGAASMLATGTASSSPLFGGPVTSATSAASTSGSLFLSTAAAASGGHLFSTPSGCTTGALFGMSTFGRIFKRKVWHL
ncbi:hypothetical protein CBR_g66696 [Chara braunii]|uniref:Uncharacterized protein n=1 Tax=Chara braunii TaxID=69332 RepID=A0A388JQ40_CHABU|nr:hypothetical protein CBR_g66696 [Chara braunii]|eukprot:GBG59891.1 hypothetical protein CBR_g66696 [Chara braunii]